MFVRAKVALVQALAVGAALAVLLWVNYLVVSGVVQEKDEKLYFQKLSAVLSRIEGEHATLSKSGLGEVEAYVQNAQRAVADELARSAAAEGGVFLLVLDGEGKVVVHPRLAAGAADYAQAGWRVRLGEQAGGARTLAAEVDGADAWLAYDRFPAWGWTVAYVVPQAVRTAAVHHLLWILLGLSTGAMAVILAISWFGHRTVSRTVGAVVAEGARLRDAVAAGRLETRSDAEAIEAELRPVLQGIDEIMEAFARPLRTTTERLSRIGRGDIPPRIEEAYQGDFNVIKESLNGCIDAVNALVADTRMLAQAGVEGRLATRADASRHQGDFAKVVQGVNDTLDAVVGPLTAAARHVEEISRGEIPAPVTAEWRGDFGALKQSLNRCIVAVNALVADADGLAVAAVEGRLATRADASRHQGDFRRVVEGVNRTLDAVIGPLTVAARYVEDISRGRIPEKITAEYQGDFDAVKRNLNGCIEAVRGLVADVRLLAQAAVEGKLSTRVDASRHQGDFARIVEGMNETLDAVVRPIDEASGALERLARRDLRARVSGSFRGDHARIAGAVNGTAEALHQALAQVADAVDQVSSAAAQIASSSQAVASGASEQASSLEQTTSSLDAVSSSTRHAADSAQAANALAQAARGAATEGGTAVDRMQDAMAKIKASAEGTSQIIRDINDIAFQTNLLALNAAVEAARAGDAGRGFAVVAEEVRSLALRAKEAATRTEELIRQSVREAADGAATSRQVAGKLGEIVEGVGKVSDIVSEIASTARQQATGIEQVVTAMSEMDRVTQQNAASAEESSSAASELSGQAEELAAMVGSFQLERLRLAAVPAQKRSVR
ncbi:MAG TPA: methyl-accepting chemotaxis protein [Anaeromyxobacter sp.]|nr:methyl-accepting chemotaxis protein [Anaeromyxobacter sp.]